MQNIIEYEDVTLMRNDYTVLSNVSFNIRQGEFVYITGRVGTGKTTLLKSLYAEIKIESGQANILGYDLKKLHKSEIPSLRRNIGFIFQDLVFLNDRDIFGNLDFVLRATGEKDVKTRIDRIQEALQMVGLKEKSYRMPFELSEGERQLAAVARAFITNPKIILADEPTAKLDNESENYIIWLLYEYAKKGATVVLSTHNRDFINSYSGRQLLCIDNKIHEV